MYVCKFVLVLQNRPSMIISLAARHCRRTYILPRILSSFFFASYSPRSLNGTQPKLVTCSEVSAIWKCMSKIWGVPAPYKSEEQKPLFRQLHNLMATLSAYIFGTKQDINKRASALATSRGGPTSSQNNVNFGPQTLQIGRKFTPTLRKFCVLLHCHASQTEISKRNSTKLCQTVDGKSH